MSVQLSKLLHITWYAGFKRRFFSPCSRTHALRTLKRELAYMRFSPLGVSMNVILVWEADRLTRKCDTDHRTQNPYCLQTAKVSFSCCHPTHLCTPCEVTFSSYLPRHMTGEHESSNQEDRGRAEGPLGLLLQPAIRQTADQIRCRDNAREETFTSQAHRARHRARTPWSCC